MIRYRLSKNGVNFWLPRISNLFAVPNSAELRRVKLSIFRLDSFGYILHILRSVSGEARWVVVNETASFRIISSHLKGEKKNIRKLYCSFVEFFSRLQGLMVESIKSFTLLKRVSASPEQWKESHQAKKSVAEYPKVTRSEPFPKSRWDGIWY